ncbi:MAG: helix-turn-helix transcriptional regulator [Ruminococcaceae bacterium]|nr:helix-turn-helix transcriptional regulator [Oscillospiraceae bacterium]
MNQSTLGTRIREARLKKKLTQEQLAELANVGFYYIGEIERGQKLPSLTVFIQIVEALGVSADSLLKDEISAVPHFNNEISAKLDTLTPKQRAGAVAILDAYIKAL